MSTTPSAPYLSVIVPCYNEQGGLRELHRRLSAICAQYMDKGYEIILVDDGSRDETWQAISDLHAADPHIVGISLSRNFGQGLALTAGLDACRGERVLIIDADLQDPPELLPGMMQKMDEGADVVYGKRSSRMGETWFKRVSAHMFYRLLHKVSKVPIPEDTGDFRLINRKVVDTLKQMSEPSPYMRGMVAWIGFRQVPLEYERKERFTGETHYTLKKMAALALDAMTSFSSEPLRLSLYLGVGMFVVAGGILLSIILSVISGADVGGTRILAFLMFFMQGLQFIAMGLVGEYIGRIYHDGKRRPRYIVGQTTANRAK